jgi:hypothetical protein
MAIEALKNIQLGLQTTIGTAVAATERFLGTGTLSPIIERQHPMDDRGSLADSYRSVDVAQGADLSLEGDATYQQLHHFLLMTLEGGIDGLVVNTDGFTWDFSTVPGTASAQKHYTFEVGDETQMWDAHTMFMRDLELSGVAGETVKLRANLFGHFPTKASQTTPVNPATVEEIKMSQAAFFLHTAWDSATPKSGTLRSFNLRMPSGLVPVRYVGDTSFGGVIENKRHFEIDVEYAVNATAIAAYDAWAAATVQVLKITFTGVAAGIGTATRSLKIQMIGKYTGQPRIFETRDGQNIIRFTMRSEPNAAGQEFEMNLVNDRDTAVTVL